MLTIKLLGTDPCHLCEKAMRELESYQMFCKVPFEFEYFDIVDKEEWYETYQYQIPVLLHEQSKNVLLYPFEFNDVLSFLESLPD